MVGEADYSMDWTRSTIGLLLLPGEYLENLVAEMVAPPGHLAKQAIQLLPGTGGSALPGQRAGPAPALHPI